LLTATASVGELRFHAGTMELTLSIPTRFIHFQTLHFMQDNNRNSQSLTE